MKLLSSLTKSQRESIGLLQIGTFLEYFDLMLFQRILQKWPLNIFCGKFIIQITGLSNLKI
jgi:hypothetical protein